MTDELRNIIREMLLPLYERFECLHIGGSSFLDGIIKNKRDIDVWVISLTDEDRRICFRYYADNHDKFNQVRKEHHVDFHFITKPYQDNIINTKSAIFALKHISYYHFMEKKVEEGLSIEEFLDNKDIVMNALKSYYESIKDLEEKKMIIAKFWYQYLITLYIFKNNSLDFTEEQLENINILHDRKDEDLEKRKALIESIKKEIESYKIV